MNWIERLLARSPADYPRIATAAVLLVSIQVAVAVLSFSRFRGALLRGSTALARVVPGSPPAPRVVWAVEVADAKLPGERKCLVRSLTAEALLRCYGVRPRHRIGVDPEDGLEAHSWLEHDGTILIGDLEDLSRYEPLPALDDHASA